MHISSFEENDSALVTALWSEVFPHDSPHNAPSQIISQKLKFQRELFFVGKIGAAIVGTILAGYDGHRGWLYSVAVHPEYRHRGLGTELVRHAEAALTELGCSKINLQVRNTNAGTVEFYRELGYEVEDRISMGKRIPFVSD
jgi:ribosomal protein S18 acetylase RimI-like enzyme